MQAAAHCPNNEAGSNVWRSLLSGELRQVAQATVMEIAASLRAIPEELPAHDAADAALFFGYLAEHTNDENDASDALAHLNVAIDATSGLTTAALWGGFTRTGWTVTQLQGKLFDEAEADACSDVDEALIEWMHHARLVDYDLISGLVGFGLYAKTRLPAPSGLACLRRVLERLDAAAVRSEQGISWFTPPELLPPRQRQMCPNGYYNLGLAHGVPGVIALLAEMCEVSELRGRATELLEGAVRWLLAQKHSDSFGLFFPTWIASEIEPERTRLAWCYGDLGLGAALLVAARGVGRTDWEEEALILLRQAAAFREGRGVEDAGFCHGAAGNAHIFNRVYQATGEGVFKEAALYWYEQIFAFRKPGMGIAGFPMLQRHADAEPEWLDCVGLLYGAVGIGLVLLAASTDLAPDWDNCLLVSVPPRAR